MRTGSFVVSDDVLDWPEDRRRYRLWDVPRIEMEDWPRPVPAEVRNGVSDLLAERFQESARPATDD